MSRKFNRNSLKYIVIPIIAFGLSLSMIYGIEYNCSGNEYYGTYYGHPIIFKKDSLGSSLTYFYNVKGVVLNFLFWGTILVFIRFVLLKLINLSRFKEQFEWAYKICVRVLLIFSILVIYVSYMAKGNGFSDDLNYWYWNMDESFGHKNSNCECEWNSWL